MSKPLSVAEHNELFGWLSGTKFRAGEPEEIEEKIRALLEEIKALRERRLEAKAWLRQRAISLVAIKHANGGEPSQEELDAASCISEWNPFSWMDKHL